MNREANSIKTNMIFNVLKTGVTLVTPLVTYSYITRVLGVENIGKINFVTSVISYFQLLASLGIGNYSVSEGAKRRDDKNQFNIFCSEIFTLNIFTTIFSYVVLGCTLFFVPALFSYRKLIAISSISMIFVCYGMEWLFGAVEDYRYISIRSIFFQLMNIVLILFLVNDTNDVNIYIFLVNLPIIGAGLFNFFYKNKYIKFQWKNLEKKKIIIHIKPILVIWGMSVASVIYINSDAIMLTLIRGDLETGLYSVATKASHVICQMLAAVCIVLLPRFSKIFACENKKVFNQMVNNVLQYLLMLVFPLSIGLMMLSREVILLLGGNSYISALTATRIMAVNILLSPINGLIATQIFIPIGKQKISLIATIMGAVVNICLNIVFIPQFGIVGAACTTLIAELVVFIYSFIFVKRILDLKKLCKSIKQYIIGATWVFLICWFFNNFSEMNLIIRVLLQIVFSTISYFGYLIIVKNESLMILLLNIKSKIGNSVI